MKLKLTINHRIYSKKNNRQIGRSGGKFYNIPSSPYMSSVNEIVRQMRMQYKKDPINKPMKVHTEFFIVGGLRVDADNLHTSILDLLQKAGVIHNDNLVFEGSYSKELQQEAWKCEVTIQTL